jgi:hypothetical protein
MNSYVFGAIGIVGAVMIWMIAYFASYSERTDARGSGDYTDARPAGLWIRFFARMADRLVYELIVCFVFIAAMVLDATLLSTTAALLIVLIAFVVVPLAYFTILTARTGRT